MSAEAPAPLTSISEPTLDALLRELLEETGWDWAEASIRVLRVPTDATVPIASAGRRVDGSHLVLEHVVPAPREELPAGVIRAYATTPAAASEPTSRSELLVCAAAGHVLREWSAHEQRRQTAIADPALTQTLRSVRAAEDAMGNALGVVLGWLRLLDHGMTGTAARDGVPVAIRRLDSMHDFIADFLRDTATKAIGEHAQQRVNATAAVAQAWRRSDDDVDPVLVLGNRSHLLAFLAAVMDLTDSDAVVVEGQWLLPIDRPEGLGTAALAALTASGGILVPHQGGHAAAWAVIEEPS